MINKEIIYNGLYEIEKDFADRSFPQNSHNSVEVGIVIPSNLIPSNLSDGSMSIELKIKRIIAGQQPEDLQTLYLFRNKTLKINGIDYVKYSCLLTARYTDKIATLRLTPRIVIIDDGNILQSNEFQECSLNVIRGNNYLDDETIEASELTELNAKINSKHVKEIIDYNNANEIDMIYNIATSHADYGWLLQVKWNNKYVFISPYKNGDDTELLLIDNAGKLYRYTDITSTSHTETALTYTKLEIGSLFVAKTTELAGVQIGNGIEKNDLKNALDIDNIETTQANIISGSQTVGKAEKANKDNLGNVIHQTYAKIGEAGNTLSITMDDDFVITVALKDINNNTLSSGSLDLPIEDVGVVDMEYNETTHKLILTLKNGRTLEVEISEILTNVVQYQDIADNLTTENQYKVLSAKQGKILKGYADGLDSRVSAIESTGSAVATLDNVVLEVANWEASTLYESFEYKYVIENEVFISCNSVHLVLGVEDADSGNFASSVDIDKVNGKITLYARELPNSDITIPTILIYTGQNSYSGLNGRLTLIETGLTNLGQGLNYLQGRITETNSNVASLTTRVVALENAKKYIHNLYFQFVNPITSVTDSVEFELVNEKEDNYNSALAALEACMFKQAKVKGINTDYGIIFYYSITQHSTSSYSITLYYLHNDNNTTTVVTKTIESDNLSTFSQTTN